MRGPITHTRNQNNLQTSLRTQYYEIDPINSTTSRSYLYAQTLFSDLAFNTVTVILSHGWPLCAPQAPQDSLQDTVFHCVSGRKMDVGRARMAGWQRPYDHCCATTDVSLSGRVRNMAAEGLLRFASCSAAGADYLSAPRAQWAHGTSGDCNGLVKKR